MYENLQSFIRQLSKAELSDDRRALLDQIVNYGKEKLGADDAFKLIFICTHNSRRSQLGQVWARAAAAYYQIPLQSYSGGTEATRFHPNAIEALQESGFEISVAEDVHNPLVKAHYAAGESPVLCFSKKYDDEHNPRQNFMAVMSCSNADENCPLVLGAEARLPLTYEDPGQYDGKEDAAAKYRECNKLIASEMLYVMQQIAASNEK